MSGFKNDLVVKILLQLYFSWVSEHEVGGVWPHNELEQRTMWG
jgi:hypothetical protein